MATKLKRDYFLKFKTILSNRFYKEGEAQAIAISAGITLSAIEFSGKAINTWSSVLNQAEIEEKLELLLRSAIAQSGEDVELKGFLDEIVSGMAFQTQQPLGKEPAKNTFNEWLTKSLVEAIRPYSKKANDFLTTNSDWETNADLIPTVKRIIISGYVGVLGIQLRKLMSIGEEDFSESKMKRYLENSLLTAKRALQLICYALLSKLWDHQLNNNGKLSQIQTNALVKFFKNAAEESITGFADLLKTLIEAFSENNLDLPIPQLKELQPNLQAGSSFRDACTNLQAVIELLNKSSYTSDHCTEAEKNLTVVLENLNFLAEYKMISIKDIGYSRQRNDKEELYLHNYTILEGDSQANNNQGKVRKENSPVISYAVLLFKENYRQNINMVPFIIDYNGLALTGGSKICFYSFCNTYDDLNLNYSFIEDNSKVTIKKSRNPMPDEKDITAINKWLANPENRKDMNFDNVFNLFNEAKKTLAGLEEEIIEDKL
jgi:hypothetical protein